MIDCNHILLAASILAAVCTLFSGNIGPSVVTLVSLAAVYMYKNRDTLSWLHSLGQFGQFGQFGQPPRKSTAEQAAETSSEGVSREILGRQSRNHRPGLPPNRPTAASRVLPDSVVPSEPSAGLRHRQLGLFS